MKSDRIPGNFWTRFSVSTDGCWEWTGHRNGNGYGVVCLGHTGKMFVHRAMYEMHYGEIPGEMCICHRCDNPICANPAHLFLGTHSDNVMDKCSKGREPRGQNHKNSKLTDAQCDEVRRLYVGRGGPTMRELADIYGVREPCISRICSGKRRGPSQFAANQNVQ